MRLNAQVGSAIIFFYSRCFYFYFFYFSNYLKRVQFKNMFSIYGYQTYVNEIEKYKKPIKKKVFIFLHL